jgi:hypothetical protein
VQRVDKYLFYHFIYEIDNYIGPSLQLHQYCPSLETHFLCDHVQLGILQTQPIPPRPTGQSRRFQSHVFIIFCLSPEILRCWATKGWGGGVSEGSFLHHFDECCKDAQASPYRAVIGQIGPSLPALRGPNRLQSHSVCVLTAYA